MSKIKKALGLSISVAAMTLTAGAAMGQSSTRTDWPSVNHDNTSVRYSPLTQVNAGNVKNLTPGLGLSPQARRFHRPAAL